MQIKHPEPYAKGYEVLVSRDGPNANMLMDYAHLSIEPGETWRSSRAEERKEAVGSGAGGRAKNDEAAGRGARAQKDEIGGSGAPTQSGGPSVNDERAFLLAGGTVEFTWKIRGGEQGEGKRGLISSGGHGSGQNAGQGEGRIFRATASRSNLFDESPAVLSVPAGVEVEIRALDDGNRRGANGNGLNGGAELYVMATTNPRYFEPRFYTPEECRSEERGKGTMNETSTRIVRTVFDDSNAPWSNLVVGEVITIPGKWSSYPPHHHPQPEIYHYRVLPEQGFGVAIIGEHPYVVTNRDTVLIRDGQDHPQVAAPGYALWYLWVVRHLDGNRYSNPIVTEAHRWVTDPNAKIWSFKA